MRIQCEGGREEGGPPRILKGEGLSKGVERLFNECLSCLGAGSGISLKG